MFSMTRAGSYGVAFQLPSLVRKCEPGRRCYTTAIGQCPIPALLAGLTKDALNYLQRMNGKEACETKSSPWAMGVFRLHSSLSRYVAMLRLVVS